MARPAVPHSVAFAFGELIAESDRASVWEAFDDVHGRVAVKILHEDERFGMGTDLLQAVDSPNVVRVLERGTTPEGQDYIAMEWLEGETLDERLIRCGCMNLRAVTTTVVHVAKAVHAAREQGVKNPDLDPSSVFICHDGAEQICKLLDFRAAGADGATWTLAVVAYRALTGELPFGGARVGALRPATELRPDLAHTDIDAWFDRALSPRRDERFQTTTDMALALCDAAKANVVERNKGDIEMEHEQRNHSIEDEDSFEHLHAMESYHPPLRSRWTAVVAMLGAVAFIGVLATAGVF